MKGFIKQKEQEEIELYLSIELESIITYKIKYKKTFWIHHEILIFNNNFFRICFCK